MTETIDIKPRVNPERVAAYAERVQSKAPWEHIGGQLHALSTLSAKYDELSERWHGDELLDEVPEGGHQGSLPMSVSPVWGRWPRAKSGQGMGRLPAGWTSRRRRAEPWPQVTRPLRGSMSTPPPSGSDLAAVLTGSARRSETARPEKGSAGGTA